MIMKKSIMSLLLSIVLTSASVFVSCGGQTQNTSDVDLLRSLYVQYVFGDQLLDSAYVHTHFSSEMVKFLKDSYEYDCESNDCYAVWLFRTSAQDGPMPKSEISEIKPLKDHWYEVSYLDMGISGITKLRVIDGQITAIEPDKSYDEMSE